MNEVSARLVAAGVVLLSVSAIVSGERWLVALIAYGFVARVLTGPTLSPLGQLVTRGITPRLPIAPRPVAGPPKRFAQGIGAAVSVAAAVLALGFGQERGADVLLGVLVAAATLESVFGFCIGCTFFAALMRAGLIPAEVCERCNAIRGRGDSVSAAGRIEAGRSWPVTILVVLGIGLVVMPAIFQMFSRAPKGATMIAAFRPYMTADRLIGYQQDMRQIDAGVRQSNTQVAAYLAGTSDQQAFQQRFPDFAAFETQWGGIYEDMTSMLRTIQSNRGNYEAVAALPKFTLFPWFFVAPGALVIGLLLALRLRPGWWSSIRWVLAAIGIGLVAAPVFFQMFTRAPKGERMVNAFKTIETGRRVETIQGYFGSMAAGQGAVRLELIPALEHSGLSRSEIASRFPAVDALDTRWVHILNDMTPMIGVMSDNVGNYDAVASLPPFGLFPWFFVLPGLLVAGLAVAAGPRSKRPIDSVAQPASALDGSRPEGAS